MTANVHQAAARDCAALFRVGRDVEGALRMVALFDAVMPTLDLQAGAGVFQAMLEAQQRQDWLALADYLEYELLHLIDQSVSH